MRFVPRRWLAVGLMGIAGVALAEVRLLTESGLAMGFCAPEIFAFCSQNLEEQARAEAKRNLHLRCESMGGRIISTFYSCDSYCNPLFPNPAPTPTFVTCQARCQGSCDAP